MPRSLGLESVQVKERLVRNRERKCVPVLTSEVRVRLSIAVKSGVSGWGGVRKGLVTPPQWKKYGA